MCLRPWSRGLSRDARQSSRRGRTELSMECSRTRAGSPGVNLGGASPPQRQLKQKVDGTVAVIGGLDDAGNWKSCLLANHPFGAGERFIFESTGGGGWGDPLDRDPRAVLEDVLDEYVSPESARDTYGVVIADGVLDENATRSLGSDLRNQHSDRG